MRLPRKALKKLREALDANGLGKSLAPSAIRNRDWKGDLATDKFVRSFGASCLSLCAFIIFLNVEGWGPAVLLEHAVQRMNTPSLLVKCALYFHSLAQGMTFVMIFIDPMTQQQNMIVKTANLEVTNVTCFLFGWTSGLIAFLYPVFWFLGIGGMSTGVNYFASLGAVMVYHMLASVHNWYSTTLGLFPNKSKCLGHFLIFFLALVAFITNEHFAA